MAIMPGSSDRNMGVTTSLRRAPGSAPLAEPWNEVFTDRGEGTKCPSAGPTVGTPSSRRLRPYYSRLLGPLADFRFRSATPNFRMPHTLRRTSA